MNNKPAKPQTPRRRLALIASLGLSLLAPLSAHALREDITPTCNFKGCTSDEVVVIAPIIAGSGGDPGSIGAPPTTPPTAPDTSSPAPNHGNTHIGGGVNDNTNPSPVTAINPNQQTPAQKQAEQLEKDRANCSHILVALPRGQYKCYVKPQTQCTKALFGVGGKPYSTGCSGSTSQITWVQGSGCSSWTFTSNTCAADLSKQ